MRDESTPPVAAARKIAPPEGTVKHTQKLIICLAAALISGAGATVLASPAAAMTACSTNEQEFAQGYADGYCGGSGTVLDCSSDGKQISFHFTCN